MTLNMKQMYVVAEAFQILKNHKFNYDPTTIGCGYDRITIKIDPNSTIGACRQIRDALEDLGWTCDLTNRTFEYMIGGPTRSSS